MTLSPPPFPPALRAEGLSRWARLSAAELLSDQVERLAGAGPHAQERREALLELAEQLEREGLGVPPP